MVNMTAIMRIIFSIFLLTGIFSTLPVYSDAGFLSDDGGFFSDEEEQQKPEPPSKPTPQPREEPAPHQESKVPAPQRSAPDIGPIVDNGKVKPMTALRYIDSFNEEIGLSNDQVYMSMGIIKQESWFKVGAKNKATEELISHEGLYDSDACVGLGQLMAVAVQDMIENDIIPMNIINADPDLRSDFNILKANIIPGNFRGRKVYRYTKKAVIILVTNPKISLVLSATFIKRTDDLLQRPSLTGGWYNNLRTKQQLKAVPMTYNAGIGRSKKALAKTFGNKAVENVAQHLTGGADKMYYAKVTRFAEKFKEMKIYDVASSLNSAIGLRPITKEERASFANKKTISADGVSKKVDKKSALANYLALEEGMSEFLTFDEPVTSEDSDFFGARPMNDETMKEFRKGLL